MVTGFISLFFVSTIIVSVYSSASSNSSAAPFSFCALSVTTAWTAIASPAPTASHFSFVRALMLTSRGGTPKMLATRSRICLMCGASLGASATMFASTLFTRHPFSATMETTRERMPELSMPLYCGSVSGKCWPMSPSASAPSIASAMACSRPSPSECPLRPLLCGMSMPPRTSLRPSTRR